MSIFESEVVINQPAGVVYAFLTDMNNHRQLMPEGITDWESTTDTASFNVQNITRLLLKIDQKIPNKSISVIPAEKPPFDMELKWEITQNDDDTTKAKFTIAAELNMLMKMAASGPLNKLVQAETANLVQALS